MKKQAMVWAALLIAAGAVAQTPNLTLQQAVETAIKNNLTVQQTGFTADRSKVNERQAKANLLPDLFGNLNQGTNQGRSIDPFTNAYINQQVNYGNYSLNSTVTLFNGFQLKNLVKQAKLDNAANEMDLQQAKDNVALNVILAFLQIMTNEELLEQARNQADVTRHQVERLQILYNTGATPPATYFDLKGQLANDELTRVNSKNQLDAARLSLTQLMNIPYDSSIVVQHITADTLVDDNANTTDTLYAVSMRSLALIKAVELRRQSARAALKVARGSYSPTLALSGNLNTYYSNVATTNIAVGAAEVMEGPYVDVNGSKVPVVTPITKYQTQKIPFSSQFNNNYNTSVFVTLQIPILNKFRARNRVALAKIDLRSAEVTAKSTQIQLQQNIEQAYFNLTAARDRYNTLTEQVKDFTESFRTAEVRFNAGAITQVDYLVAKNNLDRAKINLISVKYDYIFRNKILDYYQGKLALQ